MRSHLTRFRRTPCTPRLSATWHHVCQTASLRLHFSTRMAYGGISSPHPPAGPLHSGRSSRRSLPLTEPRHTPPPLKTPHGFLFAQRKSRSPRNRPGARRVRSLLVPPPPPPGLSLDALSARPAGFWSLNAPRAGILQCLCPGCPLCQGCSSPQTLAAHPPTFPRMPPAQKGSPDLST